MRKNIAGQFVEFHMVAAADGSDLTTGTPAVYIVGDDGSEGTGAGAKTHRGHGTWTYACAQADTNYNSVAFTMVLATGISQTVCFKPTAADPTDGASLGLTAVQSTPNAAALKLLGVLDSGTPAAIAAGTITLRSGHGVSAKTVMVYLSAGTNAIGACRLATYSGAGDTFNVDPAWNANGETTPSGSMTYVVMPAPAAPTASLPSVNAAVGCKKNTAKANFPFVMRDSTNHLPATGKTVSCYRTIDAGTEAACATATATETANGGYRISLAAADLNGDTILLRFAATGCDTLFVTVLTES